MEMKIMMVTQCVYKCNARGESGWDFNRMAKTNDESNYSFADSGTTEGWERGGDGGWRQRDQKWYFGFQVTIMITLILAINIMIFLTMNDTGQAWSHKHPSLFRPQVWADRNNESLGNEHTKCHRTSRSRNPEISTSFFPRKLLWPKISLAGGNKYLLRLIFVTKDSRSAIFGHNRDVCQQKRDSATFIWGLPPHLTDGVLSLAKQKHQTPSQ